MTVEKYLTHKREWVREVAKIIKKKEWLFCYYSEERYSGNHYSNLTLQIDSIYFQIQNVNETNSFWLHSSNSQLYPSKEAPFEEIIEELKIIHQLHGAMAKQVKRG